MKKLSMYSKLLILALLISGTAAVIKAQAPFQAKGVILVLTDQEAQAVYQIIDDAAIPGSVRKPLLQKIQDAFTAAHPQPVAPLKSDSSKKKN